MKKIVTIIISGFGYQEESSNAVAIAKLNVFNNLWSSYPHALLDASGEVIGLKKDQESNSEFGHLTIGAGRRIKSKEMQVNDFLTNLDLENKTITKLLKQKDDKNIHIIGKISAEDNYITVDNILKMYNLLVKNEFKKIHFHLILDAQEKDNHNVIKSISMLKEEISKTKIGDIATVTGSNYVLDTNENFEKIKTYYDLIVNGKGINSLNIEKTIKEYYAGGIDGQDIKPIKASNNTIKDDDIVIWMNYEVDGLKKIINTMVNSNDISKLETFTCFSVDKMIKTNTFIEETGIKNCLGLYLSKLDFTQARIAEEEKFPHVTYFFDGKFDGKIAKCDKFVIQSLDDKSYELKPEMSCVDITKKVIGAMDADYDFILVNFANPDVVSKTGNIEAITKAYMAVDLCIGKILEKAEDNFYKVIIMSDHSSPSYTINQSGTIYKGNNNSKVPFIICDNKVNIKGNGSLINVAPTILDYMDIAIPKEMEDTESLLIEE